MEDDSEISDARRPYALKSSGVGGSSRSKSAPNFRAVIWGVPVSACSRRTTDNAFHTPSNSLGASIL